MVVATTIYKYIYEERESFLLGDYYRCSCLCLSAVMLSQPKLCLFLLQLVWTFGPDGGRPAEILLEREEIKCWEDGRIRSQESPEYCELNRTLFRSLITQITRSVNMSEKRLLLANFKSAVVPPRYEFTPFHNSTLI